MDDEGISAARETRMLETVQVTATRSEQSIYAVSEAVTVINSVDSSFVTRVQAAAGGAVSALSGGLTYQDHSNRSVGGDGKVTPSGYKVRAADVKWRRALGTSSEIMLSAQYLEQPSTPRVDELVTGFGQGQNQLEVYRRSDTGRSFHRAQLQPEQSSVLGHRIRASIPVP